MARVITIFGDQGFACTYIVASLLSEKLHLTLYFHFSGIF